MFNPLKISEMLSQAGQMQEEVQRKLGETVVEATSGGGAVTATMNGKKELLKLHIDPSAVLSLSGGQPDVEMLQDLIVAAVNEAGRKADEAIKSSVQGMLGGLKIAGTELSRLLRGQAPAAAGMEAGKLSRYAEPMARLIEELKKLPGVGTKSAQRYAFHLLRSSDEDAAALAEAVRGLKASLRLCSICNNVTDIDPCAYCASPTRNQRLVCVVEEPTNIDTVERTQSYQGVYHVLHGTLSPLHGVGPDQLRAATLISRVERGEVDEVILATSPTLEGEATADWLADALRGFPVRITRIATGVPAGSDIEYADEVTMARALEGRREISSVSSAASPTGRRRRRVASP